MSEIMITLPNFELKSRLMRFIEKHWEIFIYLLVAIALFRNIFSSGYILTGDLEWFLEPDVISINRFHAWNLNGSPLGGNNAGGFSPALASLIFWKIVYFFANIGVSLSIIEKIILLFVFCSMGINMRYLLLKITSNRISAFIGGIVFMVNPFTLFRYPTHFFLMLSYAFIPIAFILFTECLNESRLKLEKVLITSVFISLVFITPHMLVITSSMLIVYIFYNTAIASNRFKLLKLTVSRTFLIALVFFLINATWIIPMIVSMLNEKSFGYFVPLNQPIFFSTESQLINVIRLDSYWLSLKKSFLIDNNLYYILFIFSLIIPITAISAMFVKKYNKISFFYIFLLVLYIPLALGTQGFSIWSYLFQHSLFDVFKLFRDPNKFIAVISFSFSVLIGISMVYLTDIIKNTNNLLSKLGIYLIIIIIAIAPFGATYPFFINPTKVNDINTVNIPNILDDINYNLKIQTDSKYRTLWLPLKETMFQYTWSQNKMHDILRFSSTNRIISYQIDARSTSVDFIRYMYGIMANKKYLHFADIMGLASIKMLVLRDDVVGLNSIPIVDEKTEISMLNESLSNGQNIDPLIKYLDNGTSYELYTNEKALPLLYSGQKGMLTTSGLNALSSLSTLNLSLNNRILFFLNQLNDLEIQQLIQNGNIDSILFLNEDISSITLNLIDKKYIIYPYNYGSEFVDYKAWSKVDDSSQLDYLYGKFKQTITPRPGSVASFGNSKLNIPFSISEKDTYEVWLDLSYHEKAGLLKIYLDGKYIYELRPLQFYGQTFKKIKVANIFLSKGEHTITLENTDGLNVVYKAIIVPAKRIQDAEKFVMDTISDRRIKIFYIIEPEFLSTTELSNVTIDKDIICSNGACVIPDLSKSYDKSSEPEVDATGSILKTVYIPYNSTYNIIVRSISPTIDLDLHMDNLSLKSSFKHTNETQNNFLYKVATIRLNAGYHDIRIDFKNKIDMILIFNSDDENELLPFEDKEKPLLTDFEIIDDSIIKAKVQTDGEPFFVFFSQEYSKLWELKYSGKIINPIIANSFGNAFYVVPEKKGIIEFEIEYGLEKYLRIGFIITITTLLIAIILIMRNWYINKIKKL
ncbi:MAG: hypothetical protein WA130_11645 [Candidatus Methanoperedens sp.]